MRNVIGMAMVVAAASVFSVGAAEAGTLPVLHTKVPFAFVVNGRTLPAGPYTIERDDMDPSLLMIRSDKGSRAMFLSTIPDSGRDPAGSKPVVLFKRYENQYRLSAVWQDDTEGWDVRGRAPGSLTAE